MENRRHKMIPTQIPNIYTEPIRLISAQPEQ